MVERTLERAVPAPVAPRLQRPSWRDSRLLFGVLLVLASVVVGARVVAVADSRVPVYAAARALPSGTEVSAADLTVVMVHLPGTAPYLPADREPPAGSVLLRAVGPGELVPRSALGSAAGLTTRPVTLTLAEGVPAGVRPGSAVDVWASPRLSQASTAFGNARKLAGPVEVADVGETGSALSARSSVPVQVVVPAGQVASLLDAAANGARVALVPVPGPAGGS